MFENLLHFRRRYVEGEKEGNIAGELGHPMKEKHAVKQRLMQNFPPDGARSDAASHKTPLLSLAYSLPLPSLQGKLFCSFHVLRGNDDATTKELRERGRGEGDREEAGGKVGGRDLRALLSIICEVHPEGKRCGVMRRNK